MPAEQLLVGQTCRVCSGLSGRRTWGYFHEVPSCSARSWSEKSSERPAGGRPDADSVSAKPPTCPGLTTPSCGLDPSPAGWHRPTTWP